MRFIFSRQFVTRCAFSPFQYTERPKREMRKNRRISMDMAHGAWHLNKFTAGISPTAHLVIPGVLAHVHIWSIFTLSTPAPPDALSMHPPTTPPCSYPTPSTLHTYPPPPLCNQIMRFLFLPLSSHLISTLFRYFSPSSSTPIATSISLLRSSPTLPSLSLKKNLTILSLLPSLFYLV